MLQLGIPATLDINNVSSMMRYLLAEHAKATRAQESGFRAVAAACTNTSVADPRAPPLATPAVRGGGRNGHGAIPLHSSAAAHTATRGRRRNGAAKQAPTEKV